LGLGRRGNLNLKSEGRVGRQAVGEGISRQDAKVIIFKKFRPEPGFLDCGGWTPLWISHRALHLIQSSVKPEHSRHPHFHKTSWATAQLGPGNSPKTSFFLFFAALRLRVRLLILRSGRRSRESCAECLLCWHNALSPQNRLAELSWYYPDCGIWD
jgi:hypothetical protein